MGDEYITRISTWEEGDQRHVRGQCRGKVFGTVYRQIDATCSKRRLDLRHEEAIAAYLAQGPVLNFIPFRGDMFHSDIEVGVELEESGTHNLRLRQGELAGTRADGEGASG